MTYIVSRQSEWPSGTLYVELETGGPDCPSPGMLVAKHEGESEYDDPRDAAAAALMVLDAWQAECADEVSILLSWGTTGGGLFHHEPEEPDREALLAWAEKEWEALAKCNRCGNIIPGGKKAAWYNPVMEEEKFCSENCCDIAYQNFMEDTEEVVIENKKDDTYWNEERNEWVTDPVEATIYTRYDLTDELKAMGYITALSEAIEKYKEEE